MDEKKKRWQLLFSGQVFYVNMMISYGSKSIDMWTASYEKAD